MARVWNYLIAVATLVLVCAPAAADVVDRIVAVVNDDIITLSELHAYRDLVLLGQPEPQSGQDVDRQMLQQMVQRALIAQEAPALEIQIKDAEVDRAIDSILQRNGISLTQLKEHLAKVGATLDDYRQMMHLEILTSRVVMHEVQSKISISEEDIKKYYAEKIQPKERPGERVRVQQILLPLPEDADAAATAQVEQMAAELERRLAAGEEFGLLAASYSKGPAAAMGGDLGYFHRGEMMPAIEQAAFSLEAGTVSQPIRSPMGLHIIKVLDKDLRPEDRTWQDHRSDIEFAIFNREYASAMQAWLAKLQQKAYIEISY